MTSTEKPTLSTEEFLKRKWINDFRMFDVDRDGKLTRKDFEEIGRRLAAVTSGDEARKESIQQTIESVWELLFNQDGQTVEVDQDTFLQSLSDHLNDGGVRTIGETYCQVIFKAIDTDGDGFIEFLEYKNFFHLVFQDEIAARASFDTIDTNKHGILSFEEFTNAWIEFLTGENQQSPYRLILGPLD